jgi:hypothetical protein
MKLKKPDNDLWILIELFPDKPWDWYWISKNKNITWQNIIDNPDKSWDWYYISSNPNITWEIIVDNPDKQWNWYGISMNDFNHDKKMSEYHNKAARIIQHQAKIWLHSAPNGPMFQKSINELQIDGFLLT